MRNWSEKARQAGLLLATAWGLLLIVVVVLAIYAAQRNATLEQSQDHHASVPLSAPVAITAPPQSALVAEPQAQPKTETADEIAKTVPLNAPAGVGADLSALPEQAQPPQVTWIEVPAAQREGASQQPVAPPPHVLPAKVEVVAPVETATNEAHPTPAPTKPVQVSQAAPASTAIFILLTGAGDDPSLINVLPPQSGIVLGHFDDSTANFIARAQARGVKVLLPLPVGGAAPLPNLNAEPDENRRLFAAFLAGLPKVDGLYVGANHPFLKDLAGFAAMMAEAKAQGLGVIGVIPQNLQTPTTPMPPHSREHGQMVPADSRNFATVLSNFAAGQSGVTVVTGPAEPGFAQALKSFAAKQSGFVFTAPKGF
ncbi:MAG: hypothetical protein ACPG1C_01540 [Alphaproteobacteria bacterium]